MATRNDFFILNTKLDKYFKLLCGNTGFSGAEDLSEIQRRRFGFYLFILENVCDVECNEDEIIDSIIDTDFNKVFFGENINDFGMDVVYINEEKNK